MLGGKYTGGNLSALALAVRPSMEVEVMGQLPACKKTEFFFPCPFFVGCVAGFKFVPSSFCVRCPSDTYQDEQGQTSCKHCPGNEQTFGKTAMTSKFNCSGN